MNKHQVFVTQADAPPCPECGEITNQDRSYCRKVAT